jgi:hypothetical protein
VTISVRRDSGFGVVAIILGATSLIPLFGIAAVPFAFVFGALARQRAALVLALLGAIENAVVVLFFL